MNKFTKPLIRLYCISTIWFQHNALFYFAVLDKARGQWSITWTFQTPSQTFTFLLGFLSSHASLLWTETWDVGGSAIGDVLTMASFLQLPPALHQSFISLSTHREDDPKPYPAPPSNKQLPANLLPQTSEHCLWFRSRRFGFFLNL